MLPGTAGWGSGGPSPPRRRQVALTGTVSAPSGRTQEQRGAVEVLCKWPRTATCC